ncbi:hypothetical protein DM01DRAFT_1112335 [Hesseltinella vesiculosa]|uniref:Uncharacterized protein n=1 Tax=Hesseltinella vesiculosa TaxID=101127 RepID=A0A1X2G9U8_9FUNG|nr:hypothetical protein DM01DRAFT_1112335 [Hesseltinella vesiculosa]
MRPFPFGHVLPHWVNVVTTLAVHNRAVSIVRHLLSGHYVTAALNRPPVVSPPVIFTQAYFAHAFQLLTGNGTTDKIRRRTTTPRSSFCTILCY